MLVLSRKHGETIRIGTDIEIVVTQVGSGRVKIGIVAPPEVPVLRSEICLQPRTASLSVQQQSATS